MAHDKVPERCPNRIGSASFRYAIARTAYGEAAGLWLALPEHRQGPSILEVSIP